MTARRLSYPTTYGVTVEDAKAQSRVLQTAEDTLIERYLAAALAFAETFTGRIYEGQPWELTLDAFPAAEIQLSPGPIQSVTSVVYTDLDGTSITLAAEDYRLDLSGDDSWCCRPGNSWPETLATLNAVKITYVAGLSTMPADVQQAILMLAAHYCAAARAGEAPIPEGVRTILMRHLRYVA